ncbi:Valine--tRNA ligase [Defluviimonas aquaemixtae]|uniref:Valine--tRNA ligase n=1 Tax=Albidovulum aquaemixtae TaxID=1542388 RepID=A0A2R8BMM5_9RHOB|nr:valine--tRNA ligase [Defluviimonas aquaemixtae]SPH24694.1 Valine--tRNA ligase [Defluviimonas aquaemixtae]
MPMEKTFNAHEAEARIYAEWEKSGAFKAGANASRDETFCIMIPPPNVTGSLHMGHAFNNTLQDILTRWHRMRGFDTLWQPGTDHAGIATQMVVERELAKEGNLSRRDMGREKFIQRVWQQKVKSRDNIKNQLKSLGASCDWDREAFTMSGAPEAPEGEEGNFHDAVIKVFVEMYEKGMIYRGKRLVNWDPHFETAISDLEVEQVEVDGHMWRLRYRLADGETFDYVEKDEDGNVTLSETRDYLTVATTRPETMLGDTGVAVHPDDPRYTHLIGKDVILPLVGRRIPIVADDYADPTKGTGAVKITPAHDFNDWGVGQRCGLRAINVMTTRAAMWLKDNADFAEGCDADALARLYEAIDGTDRYEARDWIVQTASAEDWLDGIDKDRHMVPHGDRSKVAIEPYLTDQWFVDTAKIVEPALEAVRKGMSAHEAGSFDDAAGYTRILPERDAKTYYHWLENIEPWCISRQLWWGHQIPVWYGPRLRDIEFEYELAGSLHRGATLNVFQSQDAYSGISDFPRFCLSVFDPHAKELQDHISSIARDTDLSGWTIEVVADAKEGMHVLRDSLIKGRPVYPVWRDPDVLDTWFSSGLWPIGTLGWPEDTPELKKYFPTSVLVTGFDIIFFWVARMMMMQLAVVEQIPFHTVYVHALVRDEKGKKMSKSLGNVLDPLDLIEEFGADAVRFTLTAMAAMGRDLKLSKDRIAGYRNFTTKLWNATRFAEMNGALRRDVAATEQLQKPDAEHTVNRWIIGEVARARIAVDEALENYRFNDAANTLYAFTWGKVCDWYVEFAKPLMDGEHAEETRATMAWVLDQCYILLHPIMPFVTEELWGLTGDRAKQLVHADWPDYGADLIDENADREMNWVIGLIEEIRSARAQMHVPAGLKLPIIQTALDVRGRAAYANNAPMIERLARLDGMTEGQAPKGAITIAVEGGGFAIPLEGVIDISEEKARLSKTLDKLEKDLGSLRGRLSNPKFVESAPEEVVEETREKLDLGEDEAAKLKAALSRLAEIG